MALKIVENKVKWFMISGALILVGIAFALGNAVMGNGAFNYDVEFAGGTQMTVDIGSAFENVDIQQIVADTTGQASPQIQKIVGTDQVSIKVRSLEQETQTALVNALKEKYALEDGVFTVNDVSATISNEMQATAVTAVLVASLVMLIYVSLRFRDIKTGGAAICALIHDIIIVALSYAVFRIPVSYSFIAALLTILGYSINATIVVFDRVRENKTRITRPSPSELIDVSITQTVRRCIYTSVTVFVVTLCMYVLGVPLIKDFMLPIMIGVVCGTYSSIVLAGSFWYVFVVGFKKAFAK